MTVGVVQKEIRIGMSGADVAAALGAPNIVTSDDDRRVVWIYDRVSTNYAYSHTHAGVLGLVLGLGSSISGGLLPGVATARGETKSTRQTLTVIVKFDDESRVRDFAYHASVF
jgi:outer membrane protein assembly factor BamE (lipoprotein component of BamABCDE complex)